MKNLRLYASFAAGTVLSATVIAALLISATPVNTQASTQGVPIGEGNANAAIALQEMEAIVASAEQATAAAAAAGEEIPDWDLPTTTIVSLAHVGETVKYGPVISDVNGDGLPDFIYSNVTQSYSASTGYSTYWLQYVKLNTGSGWEQVYTCTYDNIVWGHDCTYRNPYGLLLKT